MLIIALVLALIGLAALVFAVVTSNELVAWVCIGASVLGVVLLIVDAVRERRRRDVGDEEDEEDEETAEDSSAEIADLDYPDDASEEFEEAESDAATHEIDDSAIAESAEDAGSDALDSDATDSDAAEEPTVTADHGSDAGAK